MSDEKKSQIYRSIEIAVLDQPDIDLVLALSAVMKVFSELGVSDNGRQAAVQWFIAKYGNRET